MSAMGPKVKQAPYFHYHEGVGDVFIRDGWNHKTVLYHAEEVATSGLWCCMCAGSRDAPALFPCGGCGAVFHLTCLMEVFAKSRAHNPQHGPLADSTDSTGLPVTHTGYPLCHICVARGAYIGRIATALDGVYALSHANPISPFSKLADSEDAFPAVSHETLAPLSEEVPPVLEAALRSNTSDNAVAIVSAAIEAGVRASPAIASFLPTASRAFVRADQTIPVPPPILPRSRYVMSTNDLRVLLNHYLRYLPRGEITPDVLMQQGIAGLFAYSKPNPSTPYHCLFPHCNITFSCVYHFADHVANAHQNTSNLTCGISGCEKAYQSRVYLCQHLERDHPTAPAKAILTAFDEAKQGNIRSNVINSVNEAFQHRSSAPSSATFPTPREPYFFTDVGKPMGACLAHDVIFIGVGTTAREFRVGDYATVSGVRRVHDNEKFIAQILAISEHPLGPMTTVRWFMMGDAATVIDPKQKFDPMEVVMTNKRSQFPVFHLDRRVRVLAHHQLVAARLSPLAVPSELNKIYFYRRGCISSAIFPLIYPPKKSEPTQKLLL